MLRHAASANEPLFVDEANLVSVPRAIDMILGFATFVFHSQSLQMLNLKWILHVLILQLVLEAIDQFNVCIFSLSEFFTAS